MQVMAAVFEKGLDALLWFVLAQAGSSSSCPRSTCIFLLSDLVTREMYDYVYIGRAHVQLSDGTKGAGRGHCPPLIR